MKTLEKVLAKADLRNIHKRLDGIEDGQKNLEGCQRELFDRVERLEKGQRRPARHRGGEQSGDQGEEKERATGRRGDG